MALRHGAFNVRVFGSVPLSGGTGRSLRIERLVLVLFCLIVGTGTVSSLAYLLNEMINHSTELSGLQLLTSSITVWIDNVLLFSLLYWQIDRGGGEVRLHRHNTRDWGFPKDDLSDDERPGWLDVFGLHHRHRL